MKTKLDENLIITTFNKVETIKETALLCDYKISQIRRILKKYDIKPSISKAHQKYSCNENFFSCIDSEEKAYWLGFLYADGCISERGNDGHNRLSLVIALKDKNHLEKFKNSILSTSPIWDYKIKSGVMIGKEYSRIQISSKTLTADLLKLGCTPRKSLTLKFPNDGIFKSNDLIRHFIRGYFDGDGSVFISMEKHWRSGKIFPVIHYRFIGTLDFLKSVQEIINLGGVFYQPKGCKAFELYYKRNKKVFDFYKFLYKDATIFLERKKSIFEKHIQERCSETIISQLTELKG